MVEPQLRENCGYFYWMNAMPVVTGLKVHGQDKERACLFLDDEYALDLPLIEAARLRRGQTLTDSEVAELSGAETLQRAIDQAIHYLSYRPRSIQEVRRHLVKKGVPDCQIAVVIERLRGRDYVDDTKFARFWLSNRARFKPMGARALRFELRQKGINDDIVDALLAEINEDEMAFRAAQARVSRYRGNTRQVFERKLSAMLRRRGFGEHVISDVVQRLRAELEERDRGYFLADHED